MRGWVNPGGGPFFRMALPRPPSQRLLTDGEAARRLFRNAIAPNPPSSPQKKRARMRCASGLFSGFFPQSTCHSPSLLIQHRSRRFRLAGRGGGYAQRWHQEIRGIGKKGGTPQTALKPSFPKINSPQQEKLPTPPYGKGWRRDVGHRPGSARRPRRQANA